MKQLNIGIAEIQMTDKGSERTKFYQTPSIERIKLDNEISLVMTSAPPFGPDEVKNNQIPDYFNNNPYRMA
jgi:hypothetical protein